MPELKWTPAMSLFRKLFGRQETAIPSAQHGGGDLVSLVVLSNSYVELTLGRPFSMARKLT